LSVPAMLQLYSFAGERSPPTGFSEEAFTVPRGECSGCGVLALGWLVNAVAIVAASRLRNWRRRNEGGEQRQRSSTSTAAPAAPVAQGPLKIMERQASKASRETRAPGWGWMTWTTSFRKSKPALH
jgi:hypothetical protein